MQDIKKLYSEFSNIDIGDLSGNQKDHMREALMSTMPEDLKTMSDHKMYVEILQKLRLSINKDFRRAGENFLKTLTSMLSVGEDGVYSNSSRFIYELIQNVDDCDYDNIDDCHLDIQFCYNTSPGEIILTYNEKGFTPQNVFAITGIAENSKNISADKVEIGEKGIGFKSVFGMADKVRIESGLFSFEIFRDNFTVPIPVYDNYKPVKGTRLTLQMPEKTVAEIFNSLKEQYITKDSLLNNNPILFLNKLTHLKMFYDHSFRYIEFNVERKTPEYIDGIAYEDDIRITVDMKDRNNGIDHEYNTCILCRRYTMPLIYGKDECISRYGKDAAFSERRHNLIALFPKRSSELKDHMGLLYSFLPTQIKINAPLVLHAPFKLDSSREFVDPQGKNRWFSFTVAHLSDFLKKVYVHLANDVKQDIISYIPKNDTTFFEKSNEKVRCLMLKELSRDAVCMEKIFYTSDGSFENIENIISFSAESKIPDPARVFTLLDIKGKLFIPSGKVDMKKFGAKVICDIPEILFKKGLKDDASFEEIANILKVIGKELHYKDLIKESCPLTLTCTHLKTFMKHKELSGALSDYSLECISEGKQPNITFDRGLPIASESFCLDIAEMVDTANLKKTFKTYLSKIKYRFLVIDAPDSNMNFFASGRDAVVLAKDKEASSFAMLTAPFDPNKMFVSSLRLRHASNDLNKAEKTMSDIEFLEHLKEVRSSIQQIAPEVYKGYIELINKSGTDKKRFLNELLQNADDCIYPDGEIPTFVLKVNDSKIIVSYNETGFTKQDIRAITAIGESTKNRLMGNANQTIGEKGVGFKSVFNVADSVEIHSGNFHFKLTASKPTIPQKCEKRISKGKGTELVFNMKANYKSDFIKDNIMKLCLCLRKLRHISINGINLTIKDDSGKRFVTVGDKLFEFEKFTHDFTISDTIAIEERSANNRYVSEKQRICCYLPQNTNKKYPLYTGLPTDVECNIPIIIDAPFELTTSRDNVLKCHWNELVRNEVYMAIIEIMREKRSTLRIDVLKYISEDTFSDQSLNGFKWSGALKSECILPVLNEERYVSPSQDECLLVPDICAFISQKMDISDIYDGVIIDTYRKGKYKPILEELGCCKSSFDDDFRCIQMAVSDMITDNDFRSMLYTQLKSMGCSPYIQEKIKALPIFPIRTENGIKYVEYSDRIYYHTDKISDYIFMVLETKIMSIDQFLILTGKSLSELTDDVYDMHYGKELIARITGLETDKEKAEYLLNEFTHNRSAVIKHKYELKGRIDQIPMEMTDRSYRSGKKCINKNKTSFSGNAVKRLVVSNRYTNLAEWLECRNISEIHYEEFYPKPTELSDNDIKDILNYFNNFTEILKGFYRDGCISETQVRQFELGFLRIPDVDYEIYDEEDFPEKEAPDLYSLKKRIKKQLKEHPNPYEKKFVPRWEPKYTFDKTTYSKEMYRSSNQWNCCFCQMCGKIVSDTYIERNDIRANPRYGWGQMYLSLCVQCSRDYILLRNNDYVYDGFIDNIKNADVCCEDTVDISIGEKIITFTAAHLAEVKAILEAEEEIGDTGEYEE